MTTGQGFVKIFKRHLANQAKLFSKHDDVHEETVQRRLQLERNDPLKEIPINETQQVYKDLLHQTHMEYPKG